MNYFIIASELVLIRWVGGWQCANGHVVCSKCCRKLHNVCPSCSRPTGTIRNLALENLIESLRIKCKYWEHGCDRLLKFTEQKVHERQCIFVPIRCPIDMCQFKGPQIVYLEHFQCEHDMEPKSFSFGQKFTLKVALDENKVLLLEGGGRLFLFHSEKTNLGQLYYVSQFGMFPPHQDQPFSYKLEISDACTTATYFMERSSTYSMESFCLPTREERVESFLLVPDKMNEATVVLDVSGGRH